MGFFDTQNPGIGGLDEITDAEASFLQNLSSLSYAQGDILYHNGSDLVRLAKGTGAQHLAMNAGATAPEWVALVGGGDLLADGSVPLTANWDVGAFTITGTQFVSDIAIGTAPLVVTSTTVVANLNASLLEGNAASAFATALGVDDNYVTDAEKTVIGNTSNTNTGDNTVCTSGTATTAVTLATARDIYGNSFDGSAALTQVIASTYGGTGNGFTKFTGATTAEKTYTLPDASSTLLYAGGALGTPSSGTATNITGLPLTGLVDDTSTALGVGTLELGHASDTTLARSAAGVLAVEGVVIPSISSTNTLTNKRITSRVWTAASDATPDVDTDSYDAVTITAQAAAITDMNFTGTPTNFQKIIVRIKDNATPRAITWGTDFEDAGVALPTTTVTSKLLTVGFIYNTVTSKWGCVAVANET